MKRSVSSVVLAAVLASCSHGAGPTDPGLPGTLQSDVRADGTAAGGMQVLHRFKGISDGAGPSGALVLWQGKLYGTTQSGGSQYSNTQYGTIFSYDLKTGVETVLHAFKGGSDGSAPAGLTLLDGVLYGATSSFDGTGTSTIFSFNPATGAEQTLHQLTPAEGKNANALIAANGLLYGTAQGGGSTSTTQCTDIVVEYSGCGTLFSFDPKARSLHVIHAFTGAPDGTGPRAAPIVVNGTLYGTTQQGGGPSGCSSCGTVYAVDIASGQERIVYTFGDGLDGSEPLASLIYARDKLYGTTLYGGGNGSCDTGSEYDYECNGTVFSLVPSTGLERVVYRFGETPDGANPVTALFARGGVLYGTTQGGGTTGGGTIFSIDMSTRQKTTIYSFPHRSSGSIPDRFGADPMSPLIFAKGVYYGTTSDGGSASRYGGGTLYSVTSTP
jgi:uncharacterized repeat protein (TIGR03803 family)